MKFYVTFGALALFGAYSLIRKLINEVEKKRINSKIIQSPLLIRDIQLEILKTILHDITSNVKDLNNLALVCKEWNKVICTDQIWIYKFNRLLIEKMTATEENPEEITNESTSNVISSIFGCATDIFPPRILYYLLKPKLEVFDYPDRTVAKFTPDLIQVPQQKVWKPWLNHSIMQRPDMIWKVLYTIIKYPRWIFSLVTTYTTSGGHMPFTRADPKNLKRLDKILHIVSCFSFLPWLDIVISNTPSLNLLWDRPMWPVVAQIQAFLSLTSMQLFDNSFNYKTFLRIRVALAVITMILTKGIKPSIYMSILIVCKFLPEEVAKHWILPVLGILIALMISYPVATILLAIMCGILFMDSIIRGLKTSPKKMSCARYYLLLNIATILWALITPNMEINNI